MKQTALNDETKGREEETYLSFKPFFATPEDLSVLSAGLMEEAREPPFGFLSPEDHYCVAEINRGTKTGNPQFYAK